MMKRALIIAHQYLNGHGGGVYAARAYVNAFAEIFDEVTLLYPYEEGKEAECISSKVTLVPVNNAKSKFRKGVGLLFGEVSRFVKIAGQFCNPSRFDIVLFSGSPCSHRVIGKFKNAGIPCIVLHHNYEVEYFRDNSKGIIRPLEVFWTRIAERTAVRMSDLNMTLTRADKDLLLAHYCGGHQNAAFVVTGVFEYERRPLPEVPSGSLGGRYLITGDLSAVQTYESLRIWLAEYYPSLTDVPGFISLTMAGHAPGKDLLSYCKSLGIQVVPDPESMDGILSESDYYICPVSMGGGLKLRNMDGLRHGLPVITHQVSSRGYEPFVGKCMFTFKDRKDFVKAVEDAVSSEMSKSEEQDLFCSVFSFDSGVERIKKALHVFNGN